MTQYANEVFLVLSELAPWVLLGAALAGMLHVCLPANFIRKRFQGKSGVVQAVLLGVPLPLCSCGVIPAGIGLRKQGASRGSAMGFLISTPQTGVDSVLVTAAMLGWPLALFKMVVAAVTGILGGWMTDHWVKDNSSLPIIETENEAGRSWRIGFDHAIEIIRSIWLWLVIGLLISAAITVAVPQSAIEQVTGLGPLVGVLLALVIALPLYVCATASVPIAAALVAAGFPPGSALVFLMAGPATNVATISAVGSQFGWKATAIYLLTVILGSIGFALLFEAVFSTTWGAEQVHLHAQDPRWWEIASAIVLCAMFGWFFLERVWRAMKRPGKSNQDCCS